MIRRVRVTAPSRLHFGLFSTGGAAGRQFGGVGVMVERPGLALSFSPAKVFSVEGPLAGRVRQFTVLWSSSRGLRRDPKCMIRIESAPRLHTGLGVGTQLGLATAAGLNAIFGRSDVSATELAASVGRGVRSAVGTFGFLRGGFIVEEGKLPNEVLSPLIDRVPLPAAWRFVLITPEDSIGLHGRPEQRAFQKLPPVPGRVTSELAGLARRSLLPAARDEQFERFSEGVYRFGRLAGNCFARIQGGPYNGRRLQRLVARVRELGVRGVGQTSWGPTIFAITREPSAAGELINQLRPDLENCEIIVTAANNRGATVEHLD